MEKWIERHQNKLLFMLLAIMAWSCVSVIKDGGAIIPRIEMLENKVKYVDRIYELEKIYTEHTHYYNGKPR